MADSKATAGSGAAVSATRAELASRGRQRKEKKKKRRASQVLGSALSRFTRGARKQPHDEETTMAELKERARRSASKLKEKVSGPRFNLLLDGAKVCARRLVVHGIVARHGAVQWIARVSRVARVSSVRV